MGLPTKKKIDSGAAVRTGRRDFLRSALIAGATLPFPGLVLAKGDDGAWPSYYPSDYHSIVEASKKESGLTIYSNMDTYNWAPILKGFQKKYPWVKTIKSNNLSSAEVFERYYSESATGTSPASLMVSGDPTSWVRMAKKQALLDYKSPEVAHLPDFGEPMPNLYTFSADPILMAYNTALLSEKERPQGIGQLVDLVTKDPKRFKGKITTYDIAVSFGFAIFYSWLKQNPEHGWDTLGKLLKMTRPERSSGPMVNKLQTGEYLAGYFLSSTVVIPHSSKSAGLLGWSYISDGTPMFLRGMGIPKTAPQVNTAKLMLDYILSQDGQISVYDGGFTPYRNGLPAKSAPRSYESIVSKLGKKNLVIIGYDDVSKEEAQKITQKWKSYL
jgi:iron(III) transport system substrate-binding protein